MTETLQALWTTFTNIFSLNEFTGFDRSYKQQQYHQQQQQQQQVTW